MFCNGCTRVSYVCCKRFNCFGRMLQIFSLNVTKVDLVLHMLRWNPFAAAVYYCSYWVRLHTRGCGEDTSGRCGKSCQRRSTRSGMGHIGLGHGAVWDSFEAARASSANLSLNSFFSVIFVNRPLISTTMQGTPK
jgi:hypothetical protein